MEYPLIFDDYSVQIYRVNSRVYYRVGDLDNRRQCNGGFIVMDDCTIVVDAPSEDGAREMLRESMDLFGLPVRYVILTHAHPDHDLGLPVFAEKGDVTLYAKASAFAELDKQGICYPDQYGRISENTTISHNGFRVELEPVKATAHSPWDMLAYLPEYDLMFTGDLVACEPILYLESCDLSNWIDVLGLLGKRNVSILARGHGGCIGSEYLEKEARYLHCLREVNRYMRRNIAVSQADVNDEFMGKVLERLCSENLPEARFIYETAGAAAFYQLTQFYRYDVKS